MGSGKSEEKNTKVWRIALIVSTAVVLIAVLALAVRVRLANPLEGEWIARDEGYDLRIGDDARLDFTFKSSPVNVELYYEIDKGAKTVTLKSNPESYNEAAGKADGAFTSDEIAEYLQGLTTAFDYSIEGDVLTLTDREYGDSLRFERVK